MSKILFDEDKTILKTMDPRETVPEKGLEGWFHKHSPYSPNTNRLILIIVAISIFAVSLFFFMATIYNQNQISSDKTNSFIERSQNTNAR